MGGCRDDKCIFHPSCSERTTQRGPARTLNQLIAKLIMPSCEFASQQRRADTEAPGALKDTRMVVKNEQQGARVCTYCSGNTPDAHAYEQTSKGPLTENLKQVHAFAITLPANNQMVVVADQCVFQGIQSRAGPLRLKGCYGRDGPTPSLVVNWSRSR